MGAEEPSAFCWGSALEQIGVVFKLGPLCSAGAFIPERGAALFNGLC